jgi:hypothetical protein
MSFHPVDHYSYPEVAANKSSRIALLAPSIFLSLFLLFTSIELFHTKYERSLTLDTMAVNVNQTERIILKTLKAPHVEVTNSES